MPLPADRLYPFRWVYLGSVYKDLASTGLGFYMKNNPTISGIMATLLFAGTLAVLMTVAAFGFLRIGEQGLEALGYLPLRWGENNIDVLLELSVALSAPLVIIFMKWFFNRARAAEQSLVGYKYAPPTK